MFIKSFYLTGNVLGQETHVPVSTTLPRQDCCEGNMGEEGVSSHVYIPLGLAHLQTDNRVSSKMLPR